MTDIKFKEVLDTITENDMRELAEELIKTIPTYFYDVPASSTGKYHPSYALGIGGLYLHTLALCRIMNHILEVSNYTDHDKNLMRIAGMMHDTRKSGSQEAYEKNKYTNFDHPLQAAEVVRNFKGKDWNDEDIEIIASAIETHMGKWNEDKRSNVILPIPKNKYQMIVHWCDYLASRKDIEVQFSNESIEVPTIDTYRLSFGKHAGKLLSEIPKDYLQWLSTTDLKEPLRSLVKEVVG